MQTDKQTIFFHMTLLTVEGINVFLGHGNGSFDTGKFSFLRIIYSSLSFAVGDFNEDTIQDLILTWMRDTNTAGVGLAFGYNDGNFKVPIHLNLTNHIFLYVSAVSDFNSDGHLDLVATSMQPYSLNIFLEKEMEISNSIRYFRQKSTVSTIMSLLLISIVMVIKIYFLLLTRVRLFF